MLSTGESERGYTRAVEALFAEGAKPATVARYVLWLLALAAVLLDGVAFIALDSLKRNAPLAAVDRAGQVAGHDLVRLVGIGTGVVWGFTLIAGMYALAYRQRDPMIITPGRPVLWSVIAFLVGTASIVMVIVSLIGQHRILAAFSPSGQRLSLVYAGGMRAWDAQVGLAVIWLVLVVVFGVRHLRHMKR